MSSDHSIIKLYTDREHEIYNAGFKDGKIRTRKVFNYVPDIKPIHNENIYPIIIDTVCTWFKIKKSELFNGSRQQYLVLPRSMAIIRLTRKQYWKEDNNHAIYKKLKDLINEKCKEPTKQ
jgi:hypothetical protein